MRPDRFLAVLFFKAFGDCKMIGENKFFREAAMLICSSLNVNTALKRLMDYMKNHMPVSGLGLGLYDPEMNIGRILAWVGHRLLLTGQNILPSRTTARTPHLACCRSTTRGRFVNSATPRGIRTMHRSRATTSSSVRDRCSTHTEH